MFVLYADYVSNIIEKIDCGGFSRKFPDAYCSSETAFY